MRQRERKEASKEIEIYEITQGALQILQTNKRHMKRVIKNKSRKNRENWYNTVTTETNLRCIKTKDNITDFVHSAESENGKGELSAD